MGEIYVIKSIFIDFFNEFLVFNKDSERYERERVSKSFNLRIFYYNI